MSATKVLDLAEKQGLLDDKVIADLRKQVAESRFVVTPEAIAKVLVDQGHLTPFQARKLVTGAMGEPAPEPPPAAAAPPRAPAAPPPPAKKPAPKPAPAIEDLGFADDPSAGAAAAPAPAAEEEELVMLEPVAPEAPKPAPPPKLVARPKPSAPAPAKPAPAPKPAPRAEAPKPAPHPKAEAQRPAPKPKPAPAPAPPPAAEEEEVVDLTLLPPAAGAPTPQPKPAPLAPLTPAPAASAPLAHPFSDPLGGLDPLGAGPGLATLDPLTSLDPLGLPAESGPQGKPAAAPKKKKEAKNVWDSPLLFIGGGALGVMLLVSGVLYYSLTRGTAAEMFEKANEEYQSQSYAGAIALYDTFLSKYPKDPSASLARVRRGMAQLRQITDSGQNPKQGLATAKTVLPTIEAEPAFEEARTELSTILPDIADGFAGEALQATSPTQREQLVKLADEAFTLINNPAYIPATLRKERENRISAIQDKLKAAQRSIEQDNDLAAAIEKIGAAETQGDTAGAYQIRGQLVKTYPALEASAQLIDAIRKIGDKERTLVKTGGAGAPAATDDPLLPLARVVLAARNGPAPAAAPGKIAFVLLEGAVYALDVASGKALWRRHVGYETTIHPQAVSREDGADALVVDGRRHELLRLAAATGKLVWRQPIGEAFFAPVLAGENALVTTKAGRILKIELASGNIVQSAQLPQAAGAAAAYEARPPRLVQLGQHSTIFLLSADSLACDGTYYLGHKAGSIFVPPVAVLEHVLAFESPADDHTLIHLLVPGSDNRLAPVGQPLRLRGRMVTPAAVVGRRVAVATDLGQVSVYEVDPADPKQPLRQIGGLEPSEPKPTPGYYTADANRLWLTSRRATLVEIQSSLQTLARKWTLHQDDAFLAPPQVFGETLIHVRRRPNSAAVIVEGAGASDGKTIWTTQLAVPVVALVAAEPRPAIDAITRQGRVFTIAGPQVQARYVDAPNFPSAARTAIFPEVARSRDNKLAAWNEPLAGGKVFVYDVSAATAPTALSLAGPNEEAATAAAIWGGKLLVPTKSGKVELLDPATAKPATLPFMPTLQPDRAPAWTGPAVLGDDSAFVIADGLGKLYRVAIKSQPQPHLAAAAEASTDQPLQGSLAAAGDTVYGLSRGEISDTVVAIDPQTLALGGKWPLAGRALIGPVAVEDRVLVWSETDGLFCLAAGQKLVWQKPLARGPLAGPPVAVAGGDLLLLFQSGVLARVVGDTGEEVAEVNLDEPLGRAARVFGQQVFVATSDGSLVVVKIPQRP